MVTELLVRLKSLLDESGDLLLLARGASEWDSVVRVSAERARSLAEICARVRPMIAELGALLERVEERALAEAEKLS
jgi:hypothetical protein